MDHNQSKLLRPFLLLEKKGESDYIGEPVSQKQHMLQAARLAEADGQTLEVVIAALFHDIGHLLEGEQMGFYGVQHHEKKGADFLRDCGYPELVAELIENHVNAKRYLVVSQENYQKNLSEASKKTLEFQGGGMCPEEVAKFINQANLNLYQKVRSYDEGAKNPYRITPTLKYYEEKVLAEYQQQGKV